MPRDDPERLPSSPDSERAILGSILLDNRLMDEAIQQLKPEDFYMPSHRDVYCAMLSLHKDNCPIDPIVVADRMTSQKGAVVMLSGLTFGLPHVTSLKTYTKIVRQKSLSRWIAKEGARISAAGMEDDEPGEVLAQVVERFSVMKEATTSRNGHGGQLSNLIPAVKDHLYLIKAGINPAISTNLEPLDKLTGGGIVPGQLWGIGARSSMGKTAILLQWLRHMAKQGHGVVLFSLEMMAVMNALRILAAETKIPMSRIRFGLSDHQIDYLLGDVQKVFEMPLWIYTDCRSIGDIRARLRTLKRQHAISVVGIDFYGLLSGYGSGRDRYENRTQELKYIATSLQQHIAIDEEVGVIVPAQFNRSGWNIDDPGPANIDGGEAYYQACDLYATLMTKSKKEAEETAGAWLKVWKQRNGPVGKIKLQFRPAEMEFFAEGADEEAPDAPMGDKERDNFL